MQAVKSSKLCESKNAGASRIHSLAVFVVWTSNNEIVVENCRNAVLAMLITPK
jgi:hypothetical protein